jgi:hypothetical protein
VRGFLGEAFADAERGQPVENAELALAKALVGQRLGLAARQRPRLADDVRRQLRADIG